MSNNSSTPEKDNVVKGEPTKDFFITMLIKDISLRDAIGDLIDNSVDAIKAKAKDPDDLKGYSIDVVASAKAFSISDNGSGIEENVARKYAFKLGKPKEHVLLKHSIGRFGIGMKRAFFKIGNHITVDSCAPTSHFSINIPVNTWKQQEDDWDFKFSNVQNKEKNGPEQTGTVIKISDLTYDAAESFKKTQFENELIDEIAREQVLNIHKGLKISINKATLVSESLTLKHDKEIVPAYLKHTFKHLNSETKVVSELMVEVYAGVSDENEEEGGWNIFCNDRLIMDRDKSEVTGWTGAGGDGVAKYHQQFWGFRGYVFFNAQDSGLLPWNTTKTGIDPESADYIAVRMKMIDLMKDVIGLLNRQKKEREKDNPVKDQVLNNKVQAAPSISILKVMEDKTLLPTKFKYPTDLNAVKTKDVQKITYTVAKIKFNKAKLSLGASNPADVGSKTFDYYYGDVVGD